MEAIIEAIADMTLGQIASGSMLLLVGLLSFVEFTKIKVNPLSAILGWLGSRINAPLIEKMKEQDAKLNELSKKLEDQGKKIDQQHDAQDDNEIDRIRWEILAFANSCKKKEKHTLDEFDHIIELNQKYHNLLDRRNLKNGKIDLEYNYIVKIYKKCQEEDSFLA